MCAGRWPKLILRLATWAFVLQGLAHAQSLNVTGQAGYLGEWELSAEVSGTAPDAKREYRGPFTMRHVGLCTQDGPEVKTGEIHLQLSASGSRITATLALDGATCSFSGKKEDAYNGLMSCPEKRDVPLLLWLR